MDQNYIGIFGCAPNKETPAKSSLSQDFFQHLCNSSDKQGNIDFPQCLLYFRGSNSKAEKTIQVRDRLQLAWNDNAFDEGEQEKKEEQSEQEQLQEFTRTFKLLEELEKLDDDWVQD